MGTYLLMMHVTIEQERAMKLLYESQGWKFCKQDLSKTTEHIGPPVIPVFEQSAPKKRGRPRKEDSFGNSHVKKRKKSLIRGKSLLPRPSKHLAASTIAPEHANDQLPLNVLSESVLNIKQEQEEENSEEENITIVPLAHNMESGSQSLSEGENIQQTLIPSMCMSGLSTADKHNTNSGQTGDTDSMEADEDVDSASDLDNDDNDDNEGLIDEAVEDLKDLQSATSSSAVDIKEEIKLERNSEQVQGGGVTLDTSRIYEAYLDRLLHHEKVTARSRQYEASRRRRTFQSHWLQDFDWLREEDGICFCRLCRLHPDMADQTSGLFIGKEVTRRDTLVSHQRSKKHIACMAKNLDHEIVFPEEKKSTLGLAIVKTEIVMPDDEAY